MSELYEIGVVAGLLIDGDKHIDEVREIVAPEDFQNVTARSIYSAALKMRLRGEGMDIWAMFSEAGYKTPPDDALRWMRQNPSSHYTVEAAKRLKKSRLVEAVGVALEAVQKSNNADSRAEVDVLMKRMGELDRRSSIKTGADIVTDMLEDFVNADEIKKQVVETGFRELDKLLDGGVRPGELFIIGARTSVGKSSILWALAEKALETGKRVLFFSAEMPAKQLGYRYAASFNEVSLRAIRRFQKEGQEAVAEIADKMRTFQLFVDDSGRISMASVEALTEQYRPDVVVIDFLQRFKVGDAATRAAFFSDVANGLKSLAMEKRIAVYAASQFGRGVEKDDRPPVLSDFKESGGLEEAADIALLLWAKNEEMAKQIRFVNGVVAKNRNGSLGAVNFNFVADQTRFQEAM